MYPNIPLYIKDEILRAEIVVKHYEIFINGMDYRTKR